MARNRDQNQRMREERRGKILSAAVKLFATRGLAATKISDIASVAGMSQGLMYHYYHSKEEIFFELIRRAFQKLNAAARALESSPIPPREKVTLMISQILASLETSEEFAWNSTLISQASLSDAIPDEAKELIRKERSVPYETLARIIRCGQRDGTLKSGDPDELALVFWTSIKGLALHKAAWGGPFKAPDYHILTRLFIDREKS